MFNLQVINGFTPKNKFIYHSFQKDDVLLIAVDFLEVHSENKIKMSALGSALVLLMNIKHNSKLSNSDHFSLKVRNSKGGTTPLKYWGSTCEYHRLTDVLLGPIDNYKWLKTSSLSKKSIRRGAIFDINIAKEQYSEMLSAYSSANVKVHQLNSDPELPYQIFKGELLPNQNELEQAIQRSHEEVKLVSNWRSAKSVVHFNNDFFNCLKGTLSDNLQAIYKAHEQKAESSDEGYVQIDFTDKSNHTKLDIMEKVVGKINALNTDKHSYKSMAVLCRTRKDASLVAHYLSKAKPSIPVVSDEALLLNASDEVNLEIKYASGDIKKVKTLCRIDTKNELEYYKNGGILQYVLRNMI